jgi:hypothetical protein
MPPTRSIEFQCTTHLVRLLLHNTIEVVEYYKPSHTRDFVKGRVVARLIPVSYWTSFNWLDRKV